MTNRPEKVKLSVVKPPAHLHFSDSLGRRGVSVYVKNLTEALNAGSAVQIAAGDAYMKHQLMKAAKTLKVRLVYALDGGLLYVKPLAVDGEEKRLLLLLREPRTMNDLSGRRLELHLPNTLARLAKENLAQTVQKGGVEHWVLTENGLHVV